MSTWGRPSLPTRLPTAVEIISQAASDWQPGPCAPWSWPQHQTSPTASSNSTTSPRCLWKLGTGSPTASVRGSTGNAGSGDVEHHTPPRQLARFRPNSGIEARPGAVPCVCARRRLCSFSATFVLDSWMALRDSPTSRGAKSGLLNFEPSPTPVCVPRFTNSLRAILR